MENVTNANEMFFICKRLLKCEKIVSIDTVLIRWHLKTWCNPFSFQIIKPTSVYRRDKYTAVQEIYMRLNVKLRDWKKKGERKRPYYFDSLLKNFPLSLFNHLDNFTTQKPAAACKGRGTGEREGGGGNVRRRLTPNWTDELGGRWANSKRGGVGGGFSLTDVGWYGFVTDSGRREHCSLVLISNGDNKIITFPKLTTDFFSTSAVSDHEYLVGGRIRSESCAGFRVRQVSVKRRLD